MKNSSVRINKDFNKIFYKGESRELFGKNLLNFFFLVLILVLTFLSIGFANGSLQYLKKKMDDPFIKWVNIDIPYTMANQIPELIKTISEDSLKRNFLYESCDGYNQLSLYFFKNKSNSIKQFTGRTINIGNPILSNIMSDKNLDKGHPWKDDHDIGLIITRQLLLNLGFIEESPAYIIMSYPIMGNQYIEVPIPVAAIVKDLPGNNLFACTPWFYQKRNSRYYPFDVSAENYQREELIYFIEGKKSAASLRAKSIFEELRSDPLFSYYSDTLIIQNDLALHKGYNLSFRFNQDLADTALIKSFDRKIRQEDHEALRIYKFDLSGFENDSYSYDNLSVYFNSLDRIREFSAFLFKMNSLRIDMSQIESKENYNFVSKLTIFISGFLVIFSVISIILFLSNVLKVHINKIKSNLGTFKAFGMNNTTIVKIYSILTMRFLLYAIIVSFVISFLIGETGIFRLLFRISGSTIDENIRYFDLLSDSKTYFALIAVSLTSLIVLPWNIWKMLDKTPGDLIYKRD